MNQNAQLFVRLAAQLRSALSMFHLAAERLAPPSRREQDSSVDVSAALLYQSYYQVLRMVNNLTFAGIYLEREEALPFENFDIVELLYKICEQSMGPAETLGVHLQLLSSQTTHICAGNPTGIEQLSYQLLSNAFKFTPSGGTVTVRLDFFDEEVHLTVSDTGQGIPPEYRDALFDHYLNGRPDAPPPHGLGLGLSICHYIAKGHGGTLRAISSDEEGSGASFRFSFPDRQLTPKVEGTSDLVFDYSSGLNQTFLGLADALPKEIYLQRYQC